MSLTIKVNKETIYLGAKNLLEEGTYPATCVRIVDLGVHTTTYKGVSKTSPRVKFYFETPTEKAVFVEGGDPEPYILSREYSAYLSSKSNLFKDILSWTKQDPRKDKYFELSDLLGKQCLISVQHSIFDKKKEALYSYAKENGISTEEIHPSQYTFANIKGIMQLPKGMEVPEPFNELLLFNLDYPDNSTYEKLPEWDRKLIDSSEERQPSTVEGEDVISQDYIIE